jgi:hypothetical protein
MALNIILCQLQYRSRQNSQNYPSCGTQVYKEETNQEIGSND